MHSDTFKHVSFGYVHADIFKNIHSFRCIEPTFSITLSRGRKTPIAHVHRILPSSRAVANGGITILTGLARMHEFHKAFTAATILRQLLGFTRPGKHKANIRQTLNGHQGIKDRHLLFFAKVGGVFDGVAHDTARPAISLDLLCYTQAPMI